MNTSTYPSYHKTVPVSDRDLEKAITRAKNQDAEVLAIFRYAKAPITVYQAYKIYEQTDGKMLLSSFKRSVTNLTKRKPELLVKTDKTIKGPYGSPNYLYKAIILGEQGQLFNN